LISKEQYLFRNSTDPECKTNSSSSLILCEIAITITGNGKDFVGDILGRQLNNPTSKLKLFTD